MAAEDVLAAVRAQLGALASATRVGQFLSVGVAGTTLETVIVAALTAGVGVGPLAAKAVGAEASITLMFLLNDRWTFADHGAGGLRSLLARYGKSHAVRVVGLAVAFGVLYALTAWTAVTVTVAGRDLWPTLANLVGIAAGVGFNYAAEGAFTWRVSAGE